MAAFDIELNIENQGSTMFTVNPTLSGQTYKLTLIWTPRTTQGEGSWFMNIDDTIHGLKVVNGIDILRGYHYMDELPPGKLGAFRNSGRSSKPGFLNFGIGKEITLRYEEP